MTEELKQAANTIHVHVVGPVGCGKSAMAGEIEILCKALGLNVSWPGGQSEKNMVGADWQHALEMYKPSVVIHEALTQRPAAQEVVAYFSYGEDAGYLEHATAEAAREQAKADIRGYRNDAMHDNEWPSEVDSVCWGVVLQKATAVDNSEEAGQESFDYELGPAPQQATPSPLELVSDPWLAPGEAVVKLGGQDVGRIVNIDTQQATPEPVPAEQAKWCEYVAGMVDCWVSAEWPHYHHMDEDRRIKAIAGIIERRLWALRKQAIQAKEG